MSTLLTLEDKVFNELALVDDSYDREEEKSFNPLNTVDKNKAEEISIVTEIPSDQVSAELTQGINDSEVAALQKGVNFNYASAIEKAYEDGLSASEMADLIKERTEKGEDMTLGEYSLIQGLMLNDNGINGYAARTLTNMKIWNDLLSDELEANEQSTISKILSFLDVNVLREITIGAFENVSYRTNREGSDIRGAFNTLSAGEFKEWAKEYLNERKSEGIFSDDSIWNLYKAANDATYLGDDPMANLWAIFGVVDIATLGSTKAVSSPLKSLVTRGVKELTGEEGTTLAKVSGLGKSRKPIDTVAVINGEEVAAEVAGKIIDDVGVQSDSVTAGRLLPESLDPTSGPKSRPNGVGIRDVVRKSSIFEFLERANRRGSFGSLASKEAIDTAATQIAARISASVNDAVVNVKQTRVIDQNSDDHLVVVRLGKDGSGAPFRRKMDAEAVAAQDPSLKVVKKEEGRGWFVEAEERIDALSLPDEIPRFEFQGGIVGNVLNKVFGAATVRLGDKIGGKFLQAEAGQGLVSNQIKPYEKLIRKIKGKERENLSDFLTQLRDGELSKEREFPTRQGFQAMYKTMYQTKPSDGLLDAYDALVDISNASWHIQSSARLKRVVAEGGVFVSITDDFGAIGYRVSNVPDNELVLDLKAKGGKGGSFRPSELKSDQPIFKIPDTFADHLYVTNVDSVRVLERIDVMPYNAGGPRTNAEFRYFVGTVREQMLLSGNTVSTGFRTLLGSFGQDQARLAVKQLNAITTKVKSLMDDMGVDDIQKLNLSKEQYDELGDVIRANNDWHKHVTDLEDLQALSKKHNFRFTEKFNLKARDQKVQIDEVGEDPSIAGVSFGEVVGTRLNMKRGDTPLMEFGGKKATNASPISTIADQFASETFGYANRTASQSAMVGWVKLAENTQGIVTFPKGLAKNDYYNKFLQAEVTKTGKYNDLAAQLREQQDVIKRRMNQSTWFSDRWDSFTSSATEFVFGKTGKKIDFTKADPASRLLQVGFYSKFGFFNPDQFVLQGIHSLTIAAISPRQGVKALGLVSPMMVLANAPDSASRRLAVQRLSKFSGIEEAELGTLLKYMDDSGRNFINNEVIELQGPNTFGTASTLAGKAQEKVGSFLDYSTLFFREGERVSRLTGVITAFLEHRARRPNIDPLSPDGKLWITNREQDLTFRMTTQSRNLAQSGPMRVPTQWLSFSIRAMENIVVGRNFTGGERVRMFMVMGPMFGLTGLGAGKMATYFTEQMGYDPSDEAAVTFHNRIKYGLIDGLLSNALGTETAYATRVAPIDQFFDTHKKLTEESFFTALLGPSGEISRDMLAVASTAVTSLVSGRSEMVREDLTQLVRNLSTFDKAVKIRELIETGSYRSRTRKEAVSNLDPMAAAAVLFGATPAPVQNYYDYTEMVYDKNNYYKDMRKRLQSKALQADNLLTEGDKDDMVRGLKLREEIRDEIFSSRLSSSLMLELQRSLVNPDSTINYFRNAIRLDMGFATDMLTQQIR